jgi:hypothetical protein
MHAQQEQAQHCAQNNEAESRENADLAADNDETGYFDEGHRQQDERGEGGGHGGYDLCCLVSAFKSNLNCNFFRFGTKLKLSIMQYQIGTRDRDLNDDVSRSIFMRYTQG